MRTICLTLLLAGVVHADLPRPPDPRLQLPRPAPPEPPPLSPLEDPPTISLDIADNGAGAARLILPRGLFEEEVRPLPNETPPAGPLLAAIALSLAVVLGGFRVVGKKLPAPRLAFGTGLTLLVLLGFSGCGTSPRGNDVANRPCQPLVARNQGIEGEVLLERGQDDNVGWLIAPVTEIKNLPRP